MMQNNFFVVSYVECQQISITTNPLLPQNIVATNYVNFQIIATETGSPDECLWSRNPPNAMFYRNGTNNCRSRDMPGDGYSTFCGKVDGIITFTYTFQSPLVSDVTFSILCVFHKTIEQNITIQVRGKLTLSFCYLVSSSKVQLVLLQLIFICLFIYLLFSCKSNFLKIPSLSFPQN